MTKTAATRQRRTCRNRRDPAALIERDQWDGDVADRVGAALATLDERSQQILKRRWMTDDKATLHDLAAEYGVSAERIRQMKRPQLETASLGF